MATVYRYEFEVQGIRYFPSDMLRYDRCFPARPEDVAKIDAKQMSSARREERVVIRLATYRDGGKKHTPMDVATAGRWNSFGWAIVTDGWFDARKVE